MGVNEFSDLTQAEFEAQMTGGYKRMPQSGAAPASTFKAKSRSELPDSVDWRDQGAVSEVKNQGQCGSCWAFCTTETGDCMYDFTNTAPVVGITGYNTLAPNDQDA